MPQLQIPVVKVGITLSYIVVLVYGPFLGSGTNYLPVVFASLPTAQCGVQEGVLNFESFLLSLIVFYTNKWKSKMREIFCRWYGRDGCMEAIHTYCIVWSFLVSFLGRILFQESIVNMIIGPLFPLSDTWTCTKKMDVLFPLSYTWLWTWLYDLFTRNV